MNDKTFLSYLKHADKPFSGWDFSLIDDTGRMKSDLLSWSYGSRSLFNLPGSSMKEKYQPRQGL